MKWTLVKIEVFARGMIEHWLSEAGSLCMVRHVWD